MLILPPARVSVMVFGGLIGAAANGEGVGRSCAYLLVLKSVADRMISAHCPHRSTDKLVVIPMRCITPPVLGGGKNRGKETDVTRGANTEEASSSVRTPDVAPEMSSRSDVPLS